ncbi:protein HEG homolog 1 [Xenentodon cancila]
MTTSVPVTSTTHTTIIFTIDTNTDTNTPKPVTTPLTIQTSSGTANTGSTTTGSSTTLTTPGPTNSGNTFTETPASTTTPSASTITKNTVLTVGPQTSSPTSFSTSTLLSTSSSGSWTTPSTSTGNVATHSASTATSGEATAVLTTTSPNIILTSITTLSPTRTVTTLKPTESITKSSTAATTTQSIVIVCPAAPCPLKSICLNGTCQCLAGNYMLNGNCVPAQVFPGKLHLSSIVFEKEMSNRTSDIFQSTAARISAVLREVLRNEPGYIRSDVVQLEPGSVLSTVNNIFENTNLNHQSIERLIKGAIKNATGLLSSSTFTSTNLCEEKPLPCDVSTTVCTNTKGQAVCSCKEGYISIVYSNTSCKACPSGQRAVGDSCQQCPFGYAGFNCNDSALLAVVIISCVLGGLLLILVVALLVYFCWRRCSTSKDTHRSGPYPSADSNQPWPTSITPIPRATTSWDTTPSIEMTEGGSNNTLVDKKYQCNGLSGSYDLNMEGMKTFKGKNTSRYSYLVQGHENPYFLPGDEMGN